MTPENHPYRGIISSDWSECLSPNRPFDCIRFTYPELADALNDIFGRYTANQMTLVEAARKVESILPQGLSIAQMDSYLETEFETYSGVIELIQWCRSHDILFMLNSTGMIGYFQRVFAKGLLPPVPVLSAHPMIRYLAAATDPGHVLELFETADKGRNTAAVAKTLGLSPNRVILIGDSGGDGPHFEWGSKVGASLVGSMTKPSLDTYCHANNILIHHRFGIDFSRTEPEAGHLETDFDFLKLHDFITARFKI